jgi:hypothetical protein
VQNVKAADPKVGGFDFNYLVVCTRIDSSGDGVHHGGVGQGGDISDWAILGDISEQSAHDFAGAGLWQFTHHKDGSRLGDGTDLLGNVVAQNLRGVGIATELIGTTATKDDEGDNRLTSGLILGSNHRSLGNVWV